MAGHSHSANIKHRKDRQDSARSQLFLKVQKIIENIIRKEGEVNEKSLRIARENQFPKEKVYQILEKFEKKKENSSFSRNLFQAPFGIVIYYEGDILPSDSLINKLKLKKLPLVLLQNYFQFLYSLKLNLEENKTDLTEYLLTYLPEDIWEEINYNEKSEEINSPNKEIINRIKIIIKENGLKLAIVEEKNFWKILIPCQLVEKKAQNYYQKLEKQLESGLVITNIEK